MDFQDFTLIAISTLGFISITKTIISFLNWSWIVFFRPPKNLKHYGSWAIITGSTDGIGKALAFEFASKGMNLVLVGRNPTKLESTTNEIAERFGDQVQLRTIVIDFAACSEVELVKAIEDGVEGLDDIGVLVNNAGVTSGYPRYLHESESEVLESVVKVNAVAATWVTKAVIPLMLKKRRGAVINIGSGGSVCVNSLPFFTVYSSTKAYLAMFSKCLDLEYKLFGIDVQCQVPLLVTTKMIRMQKVPLLSASSEEYAKASVRWIGYESLCSPFWSHSVQNYILQSIPNRVLDWSIFYALRWVREKEMKGLIKF